jgi:MoaA/NifB/PqqE/SkfB family radical SAM enzyme
MKHSLEAIRAGVPTIGPETVHIDVTNACNTDCVTCWDHSPWLDEPRSAAWKRQRVSADAVELLLEELGRLGGTRAIVLSGMGEPFTHPEIYDLIEAVKGRGLHLTIITNLVAADIERLAALGVDDLLVGIHGASRDAYLAFHPSFDSSHWDMLRASLRRLRATSTRAKHVHVIASTNSHELTAMIEFAHELGAAQVNFKLASLREGTEAVQIDEPARLRLLERDVDRASRRAAELAVAHNLEVLRSQVSCGGSDTAPIEEVGCFMGFAYARVLVDGTVLYCCNTEVRVGSLSSGATFGELWRGPTWQALRDRFRAGQYLESCKQCGKLNQNVKLARAFEARFGRESLLAVTGRGLPGRGPVFLSRPRALGNTDPGAPSPRPARHLPVLPSRTEPR